VAEHAILRQLIQHLNWANAEICSACEPVPSDGLAHRALGTYGRIDETLIHLARSQDGYTRRLTGWEQPEDERLEYDRPFPGVRVIADHLAASGQRLLGVATTIDADQLVVVDGDDGPVTLNAWVVFLQAVIHAAEHRQQIATALTALGIEPPEPALWEYWDATGGRPG
jgi:uncharacterized damage-inducible protein DinB